MKLEKIYRVKLADGTYFVPADSYNNTPTAAYIYSRFVADMFARENNGTVEVIEIRR